MKIRFLELWCALAISLIASVAMAQPLKLKVGISAEPYPPYYDKNSSGQWSGFEIDVLNSVCQRIEAQCDLVEVAWDGIIPSLMSKKIDMIFGSMSITAEREKVIAFSRPYYRSVPMFIGRKDARIDVSPAGMKDKIFGVQSSTIHANFVTKYYSATAKIKYYGMQSEMGADMKAGRIDLMLCDGQAASELVESKDGDQLELKGSAPADPIFGSGVAAGLRKQDVDLKNRINQGIAAILSDGTYQKIQEKYFKVDVAPASP